MFYKLLFVNGYYIGQAHSEEAVQKLYPSARVDGGTYVIVVTF